MARRNRPILNAMLSAQTARRYAALQPSMAQHYASPPGPSPIPAVVTLCVARVGNGWTPMKVTATGNIPIGGTFSSPQQAQTYGESIMLAQGHYSDFIGRCPRYF